MAEVTYREALRRALDEELARDPDVFLMGEEIGRFEGSYKVTAGLWAKYGGKRVRETPISEEGFVGAGIGAAMLGLRPVVEIMTINFIIPAMDMVVNHAAKVRSMFGGEVGVPLVIRTPGGAGAQLTAQHSQSLEAWFAHVPGLKVVAPSNPWDAYGMLKTAIRDEDPVLFVENLVLYNLTGEVPDEGSDITVPFGQANVVREGTDLTIIAHSYTVRRALNIADRFLQEGISVEVVDLRAELAEGNRGLLSRPLVTAIGALDRAAGDRAILVINRRGTASVVLCRDCGEAQRCPECDRPLVFHQAGNTLRCHICGTASPPATRSGLATA